MGAQEGLWVIATVVMLAGAGLVWFVPTPGPGRQASVVDAPSLLAAILGATVESASYTDRTGSTTTWHRTPVGILLGADSAARADPARFNATGIASGIEGPVRAHASGVLAGIAPAFGLQLAGPGSAPILIAGTDIRGLATVEASQTIDGPADTTATVTLLLLTAAPRGE